MSVSRLQIEEDDDLNAPLLEVDSETAIAETRAREENRSETRIRILDENNRNVRLLSAQDREEFKRMRKAAKKLEDMEKIILLLDTHLKTSAVRTQKISRWIRTLMFLSILGMILYEAYAIKNATVISSNYKALLAQDALDQNIRIDGFMASVLPNTTVTCESLYNGTLDHYINGLTYSLIFSEDQKCHALNGWWMSNYDSDVFDGKACYERSDDLLCVALAFCSVLVEQVCLDYPEMADTFTAPIMVLAGAITVALILGIDFVEKNVIQSFVKQWITNLSSSNVYISNTIFNTSEYLQDTAHLKQAGEKAIQLFLKTHEGQKLLRLAVLSALKLECTLSRVFKSKIGDPAVLYDVFAYADILSESQKTKADTASEREKANLIRYSMFAKEQNRNRSAPAVGQTYIPPEFKP